MREVTVQELDLWESSLRGGTTAALSFLAIGNEDALRLVAAARRGIAQPPAAEEGAPAAPGTPQEVRDTAIFAWVGLDELGSEVVGIKQGLVPYGMIPLVATARAKLDQPYIRLQLQRQVETYGQTIRLCRFAFAEELVTLTDGTAAPRPEEHL